MLVQKVDTGHVYAMKVLRKTDMVEKEQARTQFVVSKKFSPEMGCADGIGREGEEIYALTQDIGIFPESDYLLEYCMVVVTPNEGQIW